ncbi:MAG: hypothetical protein Fur003_5690 [Candidatus Dojkabacteria bacterium]
MISKTLKKLAFLIVALVLILASRPTSAFAAKFTLYPASGKVVVGDTFTVDVLIDTEGKSTLQSKAVITFDPTRLEVVSADRNNSLYTTYPVADQSVDNTNGVVMVSGFTQSGAGTLYKTNGAADVFVRIKFKALKTGAASIDWEYDGTQGQFQSIIMADGSPAQNVLLAAPTKGTYTVTSQSSTPPTPVTPDTGLFDQSGLFIGGGVLVAAIAIFAGLTIYSKANQRIASSKKKTIVIYE